MVFFPVFILTWREREREKAAPQGRRSRGIKLKKTKKNNKKSLRGILWSSSDLLGFDGVREIDGGQSAALLFLVVVVVLLLLLLSGRAGQGFALGAGGPAGLQNRVVGRTGLVSLLLLLRGEG